MARYLTLRLLDSVLTIVLVVTLVFLALRVLPGDPAVAILGETADAQTLAAFRERLGLNEPLLSQYLHFMASMATFDFGESFANKEPVLQLVRDNLPYTVELTVAAVIVGIACGIPLGVLAATHRNAAPDSGFRLFALIGYAVPDFYLGALFLIVFSLKLGWFPIGGAGDDAFDRLHHVVLPALTLATVKTAFLGRLARTSLLEVLSRDYVRTARAKGARELRVIYRHALRNALLPLSTGIGLSILATLSGSVAVELIFNRPGIGRLLITAILDRDFPVVQAGVVLVALFVVLVNLLMEFAYALIDPRIRVA